MSVVAACLCRLSCEVCVCVCVYILVVQSTAVPGLFLFKPRVRRMITWVVCIDDEGIGLIGDDVSPLPVLCAARRASLHESNTAQT